jgi:hypothetical protein
MSNLAVKLSRHAQSRTQENQNTHHQMSDSLVQTLLPKSLMLYVLEEIKPFTILATSSSELLSNNESKSMAMPPTRKWIHQA